MNKYQENTLARFQRNADCFYPASNHSTPLTIASRVVESLVGVVFFSITNVNAEWHEATVGVFGYIGIKGGVTITSKTRNDDKYLNKGK